MQPIEKNQIYTVKEITEIGLAGLLNLRHIGKQTVKEIKLAVFGEE